MTDRQKREAETLRRKKYSYADIAEAMGLSVNTVKSHLRRNQGNLAGYR